MSYAVTITPRPHSFRIDNNIVDHYAEEIGAIGVAVYATLSRYADRSTETAFPSIKKLAQKLKLGRTTVKKYLHLLHRLGLIEIDERWTLEGDRTSNGYTLLDTAPPKVLARRAKLIHEKAHGGGSPADLPPGSSAAEGGSSAAPFQDSLEQVDTSKTDEIPKRQRTCRHPEGEITHLRDDIVICDLCLGLLDTDHNLIALKAKQLEPPTVGRAA